MFTAGRILRNLNRHDPYSAPTNSVLIPQPKKERRKFRCYVPFVWQALIATCVGIVVIVVGIGLCIVGYYADQIRLLAVVGPAQQDNVTATSSSSAPIRDRNGRAGAERYAGGGGASAGFNYLKCMIYLGPALMSCGSFAIVFSCVVVCETRDKLLEMMDEREKFNLPRKTSLKFDFFRSIVVPAASSTRPPTAFAPCEKQKSSPNAKQAPSRPSELPVYAGQQQQQKSQQQQGQQQQQRNWSKLDSLLDQSCTELNSSFDAFPGIQTHSFARTGEHLIDYFDQPQSQFITDHGKTTAIVEPGTGTGTRDDCLSMITAPIDRTLGFRFRQASPLAGDRRPRASGIGSGDRDGRSLDEVPSPLSRDGRTEDGRLGPEAVCHPPVEADRPDPPVSSSPNNCFSRLKTVPEVGAGGGGGPYAQRHRSLAENLLLAAENVREPRARFSGDFEERKVDFSRSYLHSNDPVAVGPGANAPHPPEAIRQTSVSGCDNRPNSYSPSISGVMLDPRCIVVHQVHVHQQSSNSDLVNLMENSRFSQVPLRRLSQQQSRDHYHGHHRLSYPFPAPMALPHSPE